MKAIPLTQGKVTWVDDSDFEWLSQFKWNFMKCPNGGGYAVRQVAGHRNVYMHRFILNAQHGVKVDHRNGDRLLNIRGNLRFATHQQNMMNRPVQRNNKSGHKGIRWEASRKLWQVRIGVNRRTIHLGSFDTLEAAIARHAEGVQQYHGEFGSRRDSIIMNN